MADNGVANSELLDLLKLTQAAFPHRPNVDVLLKYQSHEGLDRLFSDDSRETLTGKSIDHRVQIKTSGAAKQTRPYAVDAPSVSPVMRNLSVNWTYHQTDYSIERREMLQNMGKEQLGSLVKSRRIDGLLDSADLLEELMWDVPDTITDDLNPNGIPYYLVPITASQVTSVTSGFQGRNPLAADGGDFGTCGGINAAEAGDATALWRSYNDVWTSTDGSITEDDLDKWRTAYRKCKFTSPQTVKDLEQGPGRDLRFYAGNTLITGIERSGRAQNDQLGADIGKFAEATVFKRIPIIYVPVLDARDALPNTVFNQYALLAINWAFLKIAVLKGDVYRESEPIISRDQHNVLTTFFDLTWQMYTRNRQRLGFQISYVAAG